VFAETTGGKEQPVGPVPREPEPLLDEDPVTNLFQPANPFTYQQYAPAVRLFYSAFISWACRKLCLGFWFRIG